MICRNLNREFVSDYFHELDAAIEKLSQGREGLVADLPDWVLSPRKITVCITSDREGVALRVEPTEDLESDEIEWIENASPNVLDAAMAPWSFERTNISKTPFFMIGEMLAVQADNPIAPPAVLNKGLIGCGQVADFIQSFSPEKAREESINLWNAAILSDVKPGNFVHKTKQVFKTFAAIIRRKSFLERRIHRYLNEHARLLLPPHKKCYYEHRILQGSNERRIDFLLEREPGMPSILVELESLVHQIFKKNGESTAETNHAKSQIAEWISFIDMDSAANASGDFSFLAGPKQRLVVIGRGLENREQLINSKFSDTTLWTYDLLLEQARDRWNNELENQYRIVGMPQVRPF
jgi:hypothetical protein